MNIIILDSPEIKCPLALLYALCECCQAFHRNKYKVKVSNTISEITNDSIVFMGDDIRVKDPQYLLHKQAPYAIYLAWGWTSISIYKLNHFIHIYENRLTPLPSKDRFYVHNMISQNQLKYYMPLWLRANDDPDKIGTYEKVIERDYCYMGYLYNPELEPKKYNGYYYGTKDLTKFLSYNFRKKMYLSSLFALGFQSQANIDNGHVSQRIYEGLAYGCIVITNSKPACTQTNNIAIFANNREEIERIIEYYKNNEEERRKRVDAGYEFIKNNGTNVHTMLFIKNKINTFFNLHI